MVCANDNALPSVYEVLRAEYDAISWFDAHPSLGKLDGLLCTIESLLPAEYEYPGDVTECPTERRK